jgi:hypothetical protein
MAAAGWGRWAEGVGTMLRALRFWNALLRQGRPGEYALMAILLLLAPTILIWMAVLDIICWLRDRLDGGHRPVGRMAHAVTVAIILVVCGPVLAGNLLLLGLAVGRLLAA